MRTRQTPAHRSRPARTPRWGGARAWAIGISILLHAVVLWCLRPPAFAPQLVEPPAMQVELYTPPKPQRPEPPPPPRVEQSRPVAPPRILSAPPAAVPNIAPLPAFRVRPEASGQGPGSEPKAGVAKSLRGKIGCQNADAVGLTKKEKEACAATAFGAPNPDGPFYAVISREKKAAFDGDCRKDDDWCLYRTGKGPYPGLLGLGKKKPPE